MLVDLEDFYELWRAIRSDGAAAPVTLLVSAADADACAAYRTLRILLKADAVPCSVFPVTGYEDVQRRGAELAQDGQPRMVILVNCGGTENLRSLLALGPGNGTRCAVLDSHRPLDLDNVAPSNSSVFVLRDAREHVPSADGTGEESFPAGDEGDLSDDDAGEDARLDADGGSEGRRVRRRMAAEGRARARAEYYARGSFYGRPSAMVAYELAHACKREKLESGAALWHAVVGLTDQHLHGRCAADAYAQAVAELAGRVADMPGASAPTRAVLPGSDGGAAPCSVNAFANRRLGCAKEFRLTLLRHWSLYDACLHSPYLAVRLQTWKSQGKQALDRLLAELGLPLADCKQQWKHMDPKNRAAFLTKLEGLAPQYGLADIAFLSFTKHHGFKVELSAGDVVHAVSALLEAGGMGGDGTGDAPSQASGDSGSADTPPLEVDTRRGFWRAVDALSEARWDALQDGLALAQRLQRAVVRQAGTVLMGGQTAYTGTFRFVNLAKAAGDDADLLRAPGALLRLALFLQDAYAVQRRRSGLKPLVLVAPAAAPADSASDASSMVLVVGVTGAPQRGDVRGNGFGTSFHVAAANVGAPFVHDAFEAAVISVAETHLAAFLQSLADVENDRLELLRRGGDDGGDPAGEPAGEPMAELPAAAAAAEAA